MLLFGKRRKKEQREIAVQRLLTKILNQHSRALDGFREGPREEVRADLVLVVIIVPSVDNAPDMSRAVTTVTREVSSSGMAIVLTDRLTANEIFLALDIEGEMTYLKAEVRHQSPLGGGLFQAGLRIEEVLPPGEHPDLRSLKI